MPAHQLPGQSAKVTSINQHNLRRKIEQLLDDGDPRPVLLFLAGPNGAGKSSLFAEFDNEPGRPFIFVNADMVGKIIQGIPAPDVLAQKIADMMRHHMVEHHASFATETVFSDEHGAKLEYLRDAQKRGFRVVVIYVALANVALSLQRVAYRVAHDAGHNVPPQKLARRFIASRENARKVAYFANVMVFIDNSSARPSEAMQVQVITAKGKMVYRAASVSIELFVNHDITTKLPVASKRR